MNLYSLLQARLEAGGKPVRSGIIGAGKFGSMYLSQISHIAGLEVTMIADLRVEAAKQACATVGWSEDQIASCQYVDNGEAICRSDNVDVVIEATGDPASGIAHALLAIEHGKHIVMVNVEADVLAGPLLAAKAKSAGVVYSMAYGDQPALVSEMVDWGRSCGFTIAAAGKGTKYLPEYHEVTPDGVWDHYGINAEDAKNAGMNSRMFNSFLDGTKSAIEMAAIANACNLNVPEDGLQFPPCSVDQLSEILVPESSGGVLKTNQSVEVVSSLNRDGSQIQRDLRWGVYVVLQAPNDYAAACFGQYGLRTSSDGQFASQYKPYHLIGLELPISVLSAALRQEPTGCSREFRGDAVAVAKRDLKQGEQLDGEGGYTVWGKLIPAQTSLSLSALPIGLAHGIRLTTDVPKGQIISRDHIQGMADSQAWQIRTQMEGEIHSSI